MPNIASALKAEITRIARKEIRVENLAVKKGYGSRRLQIAELKGRVHALEKELRLLRSLGAKASEVAKLGRNDADVSRFSAKGFASQRRRLGLSAQKCGLLFGVVGQTIYNWEQGKSRPPAKHMAAIAAMRSLGRKSAAAVLSSLEGAE